MVENFNRILWAVDPFAPDTASKLKVQEALRLLCTKKTAVIEPVYLFPVFPALEIPLPDKKVLDGVRTSGEKALLKLERPLKRKSGKHELRGTILPLKVILSPGPSASSGVSEVISHAKLTRTDLIVVGTHSRKGLARWVMGSFAESLVLQSPVPCLVVPPKWKTSVPRNLLFPTDFSPESQAAFRRAIRLALTLDACLVLFHQTRYQLTPTLRTAFDVYPEYKRIFMNETGKARTDAEKWHKEALRAGVQCKTYLDTREVESVTESILAASRKFPGWIAMTSRAGRLERILTGSSTRNVLRGAQVPVWVIHP